MTDRCSHCGTMIDKRRSRPQMNRLHALASAAYMHWPEAHWFRPKSKDHMRYWLTVQADRFDVVKTVRVSMVDTDQLAALLTAILQTSADEKMFVEADSDLIIVKRAHSIRTAGPGAMPQREFSILCSDIEDVLRAEGHDPDLLLRHGEAA